MTVSSRAAGPVGRWVALAICGAAGLIGPAVQACVTDLPPEAIEGSVATSGAISAWYREPTYIYGHGIMGGVPDAAHLDLAIPLSDETCRTASAAAGPAHVFEDTAPRPVDMDGDGRPEVITVRSSLTEGAQLVIYKAGSDGAALTILATTPYIGRRNRWLAPAAWADLDGDGAVEVAYVDRPHLAKILRVWRYWEGHLEEVATLDGVTNHQIGEEMISGGLRDCGEGPEIILARGDWSGLVAVTFDGRALSVRDLSDDLDFDAALSCRS